MLWALGCISTRQLECKGGGGGGGEYENALDPNQIEDAPVENSCCVSEAHLAPGDSQPDTQAPGCV